MREVAIVIDSSTDLDPAWAAGQGLTICPVGLIVDDVTYFDHEDVDREQLYQRILDGAKVSTTGVPPAKFYAAFQRLVEEARSIIVLTIPPRLSVTIDSALTAREMILEERPEADIAVIDVKTAAWGEAAMALACAEALRAGRGKEEILRLVEALIPETHTWFTTAQAEMTLRGGRLQPADEEEARALKEAHPILAITEAAFQPLAILPSREEAKAKLLSLMEEKVAGRPIYAVVAHARAPQEGEELRREIARRFPCRELVTVEMSPPVTLHMGFGALGVGFCPAPKL